MGNKLLYNFFAPLLDKIYPNNPYILFDLTKNLFIHRLIYFILEGWYPKKIIS